MFQSSATEAYAEVQRNLQQGNLVLAGTEVREVNRRFGRRNDETGWKFKLVEAKIDVLQGECQRALLLLAAPIPPALAQSDLEIERDMFQAMAYDRLGQIDRALPPLQRAVTLCNRTSSSLQGELLSIQGVIDGEQGNFADAEAHFQTGLAVTRRSGNRFLQSSILLDLGWVALNQGRYDEALDRFKEASSIARPVEARLIVERALANTGFAYYELGDFERALATFEAAEQESKRLGSTFDEIGWQTAEGLAEYQLGHLAEAETFYSKSLPLAESIQNRNEILEAHTALGFLFFERKKFGLARAECDKALAVADSIADKAAHASPRLLEGLLLSSQGQGERAVPILTHLDESPDTPVYLLWKIENVLANYYARTERNDAAEHWYRKSIQTFETQRSSLESYESRLPFFANATALYRDFADYLIARGRPVEALQLLDLGRARTMEEGLGLTPASPKFARYSTADPRNVAAKLNATILFYSVGPDKSYLWAISGSRVMLYPLPAEREIEDHLRRYQRAILRSDDPLRTRNADAIYLYDTLVAPAQSLIGKDIFVVPDGPLGGFNFESLLANDGKHPPHYWIEDASITDAPSLRLLSASQAHFVGQSRRNLLLIGNPLAHGDDYPALRNAALEAADIEKHFDRNSLTVLTGAEAVPQAYTAHRPGEFSYIHFVAHGTTSRLSPLDSAIVLSASAQQPDTFKLYARDIVLQPLHAQLVTISACDASGTRVYAGEGVVGLSWAFLRAGAHNVIGTLWEVSDLSAPMLMERMYADLEQGLSPPVALRDAKLSLLRSEGAFRKPLYWAAFQLYAGGPDKPN